MHERPINIIINPTEAFDDQEPVIRQLRLSHHLIDLINHELVQHGIVIVVDVKHNRENTEGGV